MRITEIRQLTGVMLACPLTIALLAARVMQVQAAQKGLGEVLPIPPSSGPHSMEQVIYGQFHIPVWFDLSAVFFFAITGALVGMKRGTIL